jgi:uncharacterized membrane protein
MERHSIGYFLEHLIMLMSVMLIATMDVAAASREEHFRIPGYPVTVKIFLRHRGSTS